MAALPALAATPPLLKYLRRELDHSAVFDGVAQFDWMATHLAVLDVDLAAHRRIQHHRDFFPAVRAREEVLHAFSVHSSGRSIFATAFARDSRVPRRMRLYLSVTDNLECYGDEPIPLKGACLRRNPSPRALCLPNCTALLPICQDLPILPGQNRHCFRTKR